MNACTKVAVEEAERERETTLITFERISVIYLGAMNSI